MRAQMFMTGKIPAGNLLLNDCFVKLPSNIHVYTFVLLSTLVRKDSFNSVGPGQCRDSRTKRVPSICDHGAQLWMNHLYYVAEE